MLEACIDGQKNVCMLDSDRNLVARRASRSWHFLPQWKEGSILCKEEVGYAYSGGD